jgi:hypothetical protein
MLAATGAPASVVAAPPAPGPPAAGAAVSIWPIDPAGRRFDGVRAAAQGFIANGPISAAHVSLDRATTVVAGIYRDPVLAEPLAEAEIAVTPAGAPTQMVFDPPLQVAAGTRLYLGVHAVGQSQFSIFGSALDLVPGEDVAAWFDGARVPNVDLAVEVR